MSISQCPVLEASYTYDYQYSKLLERILDDGIFQGDRTGTGRRSVFGHTFRVNVGDSFPLLTTKKVSFHNIAHELLWFMSGDTNVKYLQDHNVPIWNSWSDEAGDLGPIYGKQLRCHGPEQVDQLQKVVEDIRRDPQSRRHIVTTWNPSDLSKMRLEPCHGLVVQFHSSPQGDEPEEARRTLSMSVYCRSGDVPLGTPYNTASYALLLEIVAVMTDHEPLHLYHITGDAHIYSNQESRVRRFLEERDHVSGKNEGRRHPHLSVTGLDLSSRIDDVSIDNFELKHYNHQGVFRFPAAAI